MSSSDVTPQPHLLVYPFPSSGHLIPLLDLTARLLRQGISFTAVVLPDQRPLLDPLHSTPLIPPPPSAPSSSLPVNVPINPVGLVPWVRSFCDHQSPATARWFESEPGRSPPIAILSDFFLGWTLDLGSSSVPPQQVLTWLNNQKQNSVVYACFGSRLFLSNEQRVAVGVALEQSGVNFIWCDRHPAGDEPDVLLGFEDRMAGRGLLIRGWAPQIMILRHRAIGAFLMHCGWNSVLEGISSVVMLTWPMGYDQYMDAKLLVDELGVGIRASEGETAVPDPAQLGQVIAESIPEETPERARAEKLREATAAAVSDGGSLVRDLDDFVKKLGELQSGRLSAN